jgi:serine/threonine protein kinase
MHHPNIVDFHRSFTYGDNTYVVLELCENRSLMEMVKARKYLTGPEVRAFTIQTAGAIKYMHSKNVIHRDLKMGNIFLDANMNIKVGDFGLAALLYSPEGRRTTICGTPNYIAPEILEKSRSGHNFEVDLWSLGIIMSVHRPSASNTNLLMFIRYAMLVGTPPFQASTQEDIYKKVRSRDYDWPSPEKRIIPDEAKDLVASLLVEAGSRLTPDDIVEHNFFVYGYFLDEIRPEYRYSKPEVPLQPIPQTLENKQKYFEYCQKAGVGKDSKGRYWPCVGTDGGKEIIGQIQEEDLKGLAPIPGSPSVYKGSRPATKFATFRDVVAATSTTATHQQSGFPKTISVPTLPDVYSKPIRPKQSHAAELRELNRPSAPQKSIMKDILNRNELLQAPPQRPPTAIITATATGQGLLESARRRPSPKTAMDYPESQRSERPLTRSVTASTALASSSDATAMRGASVLRSVSSSVSTAKPRGEVEPQAKAMANTKMSIAAKPRSNPVTGTNPRSTVATKTSAVTQPNSEPLLERESKPIAGVRTKTTANSILNPPTEPQLKPSVERKAKTAARSKTEVLAETESKPKVRTLVKARSQADVRVKTLVKSRSQYLTDPDPIAAAKSRPERKTWPEEISTDDRQPSRGRRAAASANTQDSKSGKTLKADDLALTTREEASGVSRQPPTKPVTRQPTRLASRQRTRLISPRDHVERLPKTVPDEAIKGCVVLYENLRKAMGYADYGDEFDQLKPQTEVPNYVVKWVDYSTKFGVGYILKDGTIGCLFNENGDLPTSVIVRAAERHVTSRACADYADRYQIIPPAGCPIEFLESVGESGFLRAFVNPREYKIKLGEDGRAEKLGPGKDCFDDLKRKDVTLWRKFANYMCETLGRTDSERYKKPTTKPTDTIVTFYQRFGDVGVWGFGDGSFQVSRGI